MEPAVFGASTSLVEMPISWSLDDYPAYEFGATPSLMSYQVGATAFIDRLID
jgi:hypothetical protein